MKRWSASLTLRRGIAWRLREWMGLHVYGIYARSVSAPAVAPSSEGGACAWRVFESADLDALLACSGDPRLDLDEAFVRSALAKGDACAAVFSDGRLVSYYWLAFTPTRHASGVFVDFGPTYRYGYKAFTTREFRGHHAIRLVKTAADDYSLRRGRTRAINFVATDNKSSIRFVLGVGFQRVGFAGYVKLGPIFLPFRTAGARSESFRFFMPR